MGTTLDVIAMNVALRTSIGQGVLGRVFSHAFAGLLTLAVGRNVRTRVDGFCCHGPNGTGECQTGNPGFDCWPAYGFCTNDWSSCWCSTISGCSYTSCCDEFCPDYGGYCVVTTGLDPLHCSA